MSRPIVYYQPLAKVSPEKYSKLAGDLLKQLVQGEKLKLASSLPIKIHPGAIGNTAFIPAKNYLGIITFLKRLHVKPYFVETCMSGGKASNKQQEFDDHGFSKMLPTVIADGPKGQDDVAIPNTNSKYFKSCFIAKKLAESPQALVVTHFKGHSMAGFGGAIKMLGIGFASGYGKTVVHSTKSSLPRLATIAWNIARKSGFSKLWVHKWDTKVVSAGPVFNQRVVEYAKAAVTNKKLIYLTFSVNLVRDCDCWGKFMEPEYPDLGIFASTDPVAIDKAVFDLLKKREGKTPFEGEDIFAYAESLGLGSADYQLKTKRLIGNILDDFTGISFTLHQSNFNISTKLGP